MRSRYSAYYLSLAKYIIKTTHKDNQDFTNNIQQWEDEILEFCRNFTFEKLTILEHSNQNDTVAFVKFQANISLNNEDHTFIEHSRFEKVENQWLYHSVK